MASNEINKTQNSSDFPLPFFRITQDFKVTDFSAEAMEYFTISDTFMEMVDPESRKKAEKVILSSKKGETELAMLTKMGTLNTFKINFKWSEKAASLVCTPQDNHMKELIEKIEQQQRRLAETDLELLFKKEELEASLKRITELSGPVIFLSDKLVLIPLFGDLDAALLSKNRSRIADVLHKSSAEKAIIDFHAVGTVSKEGADQMSSLLAEFQLMGIEPNFSALKPAHVFALNQSGHEFKVPSLSSLKQAIRSLFGK